MSSLSTTTTNGSRDDAARALRARGVIEGNIAAIANGQPPELVHAWCQYAAGQRHMGPGALVDGIRTGHQPPNTPHQPSSRDQAIYGQEIASWLRQHFPGLCKVDRRVIEWERKVYGDAAAARLEHHDQPHYAAVAAVIRLHYQQGRSLTVKAHGPAIRAAVRITDDEAIADYRAIAVKREEER